MAAGLNSANSTANTANSTANSASSTANTAKSTAETAQSTANAAQTAANNAQTTANTANTNATNAQNTANTANTTANAAKNAIDNLEIGGRNLARYGTICPYTTGKTTVDNTNFITSGTSTFSRIAVSNEGPIIDRYIYYVEGEKYVIHFKMRKLEGTISYVYF